MTLLDAPAFNARKAHRNQVLGVTALVVVIVGGIAAYLWFLQIPWWLWHFPADHKVDKFMATVESGNLQAAFGQWNNDPNWQAHAQQYQPYTFDEFQKDWGPNNQDYGPIKSHKIVIAHHAGNGVVIGVVINGQSKPLFLRVDDKAGTIGFSPVELYSGP
jgi:hypothetical protein